VAGFRLSNGIILDDRVLLRATPVSRDLILNYDEKFTSSRSSRRTVLQGRSAAFLGEIARIRPRSSARPISSTRDNFEKFVDTLREDGFADFVKPKVFYDFL
jgi:hypothetical protein